MAGSPEFFEAYLAYQQDEKTFLARKAHFLESMATTPEKLGVRVLASLREEEDALRVWRRELLREFKEQNGFDLEESESEAE